MNEWFANRWNTGRFEQGVRLSRYVVGKHQCRIGVLDDDGSWKSLDLRGECLVMRERIAW